MKNEEKLSEYKGDLWESIKINIAYYLIIIFSFGIGYPWAVCLKESYYISHTKIDGKQLYFDGHGHQLIGKYLVWFLLLIVTLGIYSLFITTKMRKWRASHTHFVD